MFPKLVNINCTVAFAGVDRIISTYAYLLITKRERKREYNGDCLFYDLIGFLDCLKAHYRTFYRTYRFICYVEHFVSKLDNN
jgi:hypothetical protein